MRRALPSAPVRMRTAAWADRPSARHVILQFHLAACTTLMASALIACPASTSRVPIVDELGRKKLVVDVEGSGVEWASVTVTAPDLEAPLEFRLDRHLNEGGAYGPIAVPAGEHRRVLVRAFDAAGRETHAGITILTVGRELTPQAAFMLDPPNVTGRRETREPPAKSPEPGVWGNSVRAFVGSYRVALTPRVLGTGEGPFSVEGRVFDADDRSLALDRKNTEWTLPDDGSLSNVRFDVRAEVARATIPRWVPPDETRWIELCYLGGEGRPTMRYCKEAPRPPSARERTFPPLLFQDSIVEVDGGAFRNCARRKSGWVRCWGVGNTVPPNVLDTFHFASISVADAGWTPTRSGQTCGLLSGRPETVCWTPSWGLPTGSPPQNPTTVPGGNAFSFVNSGDYQSCGLTSGNALCWVEVTGSSSSTTPSALPGGQLWQKLSGGQGFSCGITTANDAYCVGRALYGQLGTTSDPNLQPCTFSGSTGLCANVPVPVAGNHKFSDITAGAGGACALDTAGYAWCWGKFTGNDAVRDSPTPVAVDGGRVYARIESANAHTCAMLATGEVYCWGFGKYGQLGDGTGDNVNASFAHSPVAVATTARYRAIGVALHISCGVLLDGSRVDCWGWNLNGELNRASPGPYNLPGAVLW